jgi:hypothetical protein
MAFTHEGTGGGAAESVGGAGNEDAGHEIVSSAGGVLVPIPISEADRQGVIIDGCRRGCPGYEYFTIRAEKADVARGGGASVKITAGAQGVRMWSVCHC